MSDDAEDEEEAVQQPSKPQKLIYKDKNEATAAFKDLLKEKVTLYFCTAHR